MRVEVRNNDVEGAIRVLRRNVQREGIMRKLRQQEFYEKPSVARKRKSEEAQKRARRTMRRQAEANT